MKTIQRTIYPFLLVFILHASSDSGDSVLSGMWCVGQDGLVLTFSGQDTIQVSSSSDETVQGCGNYQRDDSSFTALVNNGDVAMHMRYRYRWNGIDTIEAKAELFTINGDTVAAPPDWMLMVRCGKKAAASDQTAPESIKPGKEKRSGSKPKPDHK